LVKNMAEVPARPTVTRVIDPDTWIKRQVKMVKEVAVDNYKIGIGYPKADPIEAGIEAEEAWWEGLKNAKEKGLRVIGLRGTNMEEWHGYSLKFADRLADGVILREKEIHDFVDPWHPILLRHLAEVDKKPKVTLKQRIEKAVANMEGLAALKAKWRPGGGATSPAT